ncbi:hypothetical protein [Streptomyces sp. MMBL 11-1]|uniref:hypothetical protein n=1 Tax=Streptomyces sp. MMBL 11-1 TaxID=3026420 RepID=UPI0023611DDF|nr:hypothetical protein [Streptomyces sp. MMBL 11-1]
MNTSSRRPEVPVGNSAPSGGWRRVSEWWQHSWLGTRWDYIGDALYDAAPWARALIRGVAVAAAPLAALYATTALLLAWVEVSSPAPGGTGLLAVLTEPVRTYLEDCTRALPITAETGYRFWQFVGCTSFLFAVYHRGFGRVIWGLWGAASVAMVWAGAPDTGRAVSAGIAVFAWSAASAAAWRGMRLRRPAPAAETRLRELRVDVRLHGSTPAPRFEGWLSGHLN